MRKKRVEISRRNFEQLETEARREKTARETMLDRILRSHFEFGELVRVVEEENDRRESLRMQREQTRLLRRERENRRRRSGSP